MSNANRRPACLLLTAAKGNKREARGLIGRAIRSTLGARKWNAAPHYVNYTPDGRDEARARYTLDVTGSEFDALMEAIGSMAEAEGWTGAPVDCYHD